MVEKVLTRDNTSVEIRDKQATTASSAAFQLAWFPRPLPSRADAVPRVQNLTGFLLKWREQKLNLDSDEQHRADFFGLAVLLKAFVDEIEKETTPETGYEAGQLRVSASVPTWEQRFEQLRRLPENWDSYGASRIRDKAIEKGKSILTAMTAAGISQVFFVTPAPNGGIQIEWELPGKELVLEIPPTGEQATYLLVETTATGEEREIEEMITEAEGFEQLLERISI